MSETNLKHNILNISLVKQSTQNIKAKVAFFIESLLKMDQKSL